MSLKPPIRRRGVSSLLQLLDSVPEPNVKGIALSSGKTWRFGGTCGEASRLISVLLYMQHNLGMTHALTSIERITRPCF